jgi:plastocyanin
VRLLSRWIAASGVALAACGATPGPAGSGDTFLIQISSFRFIPQDLTVPPGATIIVENDDPIPHSVTSEASAGAFTPGAVQGVSFDTGQFSSGLTAFRIPASAADGTVVPFYCSVHAAAMITPEGSVTVRAR